MVSDFKAEKNRKFGQLFETAPVLKICGHKGSTILVKLL